MGQLLSPTKESCLPCSDGLETRSATISGAGSEWRRAVRGRRAQSSPSSGELAVPPAQRPPAPPCAPRSPIARYSSCSTGKRQLRAQKLQVAPPPREARAPVRRIAAQHPRRALPAHAARPCPPPHARPPRPVCGLLRSDPAYTPHPACAPAASSRSPTPFSLGGAGTPLLVARRGRGDGPRAARAACRRAPPPDEDRTEA
eukprot:scaffold28176_cov38-Phaeocystis_antarctica.AAC.1